MGGTFSDIVKEGFNAGSDTAKDFTMKGAIGGAFVGGLTGQFGGETGSLAAGFAGGAVGGAAGFAVGSIAGALIVTPCAVVAGAISAVDGKAGGAFRNLSNGIEKLCNRLSGAREAWRSEHAASIVPLLAAAAAAVKLGVLSEEEAQKELDDFIDRQIPVKWDDKDKDAEHYHLFTTAQIQGSTLLSFAKLRQCYPTAPKDDIMTVASKLGRGDRRYVDAAWVACGPKHPNDWLAETKAILPEKVSDVTVELLKHGLDVKFQVERESLAGILQERIPKHSDPLAYLKVVDAFKDGEAPPLEESGGPSPAEFWKLVSLLRSSIPTPEWATDLPIEAFLETESQWKEKRKEQHAQLLVVVKANLGMCPEFESEMPESVELLKQSR
mmetsp:Transcript_4829/g.8616  ORF Transcript_4829/g.8616 Transcript_4829/m.8616 type:complete len:383 (-) Transcript_4829:40-1188(-)